MLVALLTAFSAVLLVALLTAFSAVLLVALLADFFATSAALTFSLAESFLLSVCSFLLVLAIFVVFVAAFFSLALLDFALEDALEEVVFVAIMKCPFCLRLAENGVMP